MAGLSGARWRRAQALCLANSRTCIVCGHSGSDSADHIIPKSRGGALYDQRNLAPCHHLPCPTCARRCNREKGNKLLAEMPPRLVTSERW